MANRRQVPRTGLLCKHVVQYTIRLFGEQRALDFS